jgi:hypothetical protein
MGNCDFCSGTGEVVGVVGMVSLQFGLFEDEEEAVHTRGGQGRKTCNGKDTQTMSCTREQCRSLKLSEVTEGK